MNVHVIGEIATAEKHMELHRTTMRNSTSQEEYAHNKKEFIKARNRALALKRKMDYERKMSDLADDLD